MDEIWRDRERDGAAILAAVHLNYQRETLILGSTSFGTTLWFLRPRGVIHVEIVSNNKDGLWMNVKAKVPESRPHIDIADK